VGSINFYVGNHLGFDDFTKYVEPELSRQGLIVTDKTTLPYHSCFIHTEGMFVAAHGEGNLSEIVEQSIKDLSNRDNKGNLGFETAKLRLMSEEGYCFLKIQGVYEGDNSASEIFLSHVIKENEKAAFRSFKQRTQE
tara:strand:- start:2512 stop:2922 length:411 start_codon:yes stop_codon:yes gene_type:complete